ncbi:hypothetical protein D6745_01635 [Candidatus Woesearchaeota archaeon]|nr:MAG: hypothetical protein D6745_01635 [Candidatus Woesearchaeota archaeon]
MKDGKLHIQFACTANQGRSPVAEAIARRAIKELGLEDRLDVSSSGTQAESINNRNYDWNGMLYVLDKGLDYNSEAEDESKAEPGKGSPIYTPTEKDLVRSVISRRVTEDHYNSSEELREIIDSLIRKTAVALSSYEHEQRGIYLREQGLELGETGKPTVADETIDLFLAMDPRNAGRAREILKGLPAVVTTLHEFVGEEKPVENAWGHALPSIYKEMYSRLQAYTENAVRKAAQHNI